MPPVFKIFDPWVQRLAYALALIGGIGILVSMGVTLVSTAAKNARRGLDGLDEAVQGALPEQTWAWFHSILGEEEFVALAIGFGLLATLPLAQLHQVHIRVDLLKSVLPSWSNRFMDFLANLTFTELLWGVVWYQWLRVVKKVRGDKPGFWDHLLAFDFAAAASRFKPGNTQILNIPKAWLLLGAEILIALALLISLYCTLRSLRDLKQPEISGEAP